MKSQLLPLLIAMPFLAQVSACTAKEPATQPSTKTSRASSLPFKVEEMGQFSQPWAMAFLPDGRALITEKTGNLKLRAADGSVRNVIGTPTVFVGGQGGFGDVAIHPRFAENRLVYLSWVEKGGDGTSGAVVGRATLSEGDAPKLEGLSVIWRQTPKVKGAGHFGHRIAFAPDGMLYISSGDRQKFEPAQDRTGTLGKIVRIYDSGVIPKDNPDTVHGGITGQIWSLGHRNPLGLAFDQEGRLWNTEMGPAGGDELNLVKRAGNYGYPVVSNGTHYDGRDIPDHSTSDGFEAPKAWWNPAISPGSLMIYSGTLFPRWTGDAFIGALGGTALVRVDLNGEAATKAEQWDMGARIREVEQGPDGAIWLLEDGVNAKLLRLTPLR